MKKDGCGIPASTPVITGIGVVGRGIAAEMTIDGGLAPTVKALDNADFSCCVKDGHPCQNAGRLSFYNGFYTLKCRNSPGEILTEQAMACPGPELH